MMFWQFRKLTYDILIPPLGKSIYQLSEQEAADYFAWFHTEPIHMTHVQAARILNRTSQDTNLLRIYKIWAEKMP